MKKTICFLVTFFTLGWSYGQDFLGLSKTDILKIATGKQNFMQKEYTDGRTAMMWYEPKLGIGIVVSIRDNQSYETVWFPMINEKEVIEYTKAWLTKEYTKVEENRWRFIKTGMYVYVDFSKQPNTNKNCFVFHH